MITDSLKVQGIILYLMDIKAINFLERQYPVTDRSIGAFSRLKLASNSPIQKVTALESGSLIKKKVEGTR